MFRSILIAAFALAFASSAVFADDKADRVKKLKEQIAETEKKLADLKKELAKEEPEPKYVDAKEDLWQTGAPDVGTRGMLADNTHKVMEVIDEETVAIQLGYKGTGPTFLVRGISTKGWADDMLVHSSGMWNVVTTMKYRGKTVFALRPTDGSGAKFEKAK